MAASPRADRSRPKEPATSTRQSGVPDTLASMAAVAVGGFLEHQVVAVETERVADKLQRDAVVAAKGEPAEGVDVPVRQFWQELDAARGDDVGRDGDDCRARGQRALRGFDGETA